MIKLKSLIKETLNVWGGWVIEGPDNSTATVSIWKVPGVWKNEEGKWFYDKSTGPRFEARIDFTGQIRSKTLSSHNGATVYVAVQDNSQEAKQRGGYRNAKSKEEILFYVKKKLEDFGFPTEGIENAKVKLSMHTWGDNPEEYMSQAEYNPDDHLAQSKFKEKIKKAVGDVNYRLSHPSEFDDK